MKRVTFKVSFVMPEDATVADCREYVIDAVGTMHGSYRPPGAYGEGDPGDPFHGFDDASLRVTRLRKRKSERAE